ncbi:hypothetical protein D3C77_413270 [compost metagenome]
MKHEKSTATVERKHQSDAQNYFLLLCADQLDPSKLSAPAMCEALTVRATPPENWHKVFDKVVVAASKAPLDHLKLEVATSFAVAVWYFSDMLTDSLEQRLRQPGLAPVRKRRLMYLVDRLRRFPVMEPEQASKMKSFVDHWRYLATTAASQAVRKAVKVNRYDKVAITWGLEENVSGLMSKVLEYQTRHFVDQHALPSGYPVLSSRKGADAR